MRRKLIIWCLLVVILLPVRNVFAETKENTKLWLIAQITGPLSLDKRWKYYFQPQLNLIDDKYKFHNVFGYAGFGYQTDAYKIAWLMGGYSVTKTQSGNIRHLAILREQLNWNMSEVCLPYLSSISRLEERKDLDETTWNVRLRQQVMLRLPLASWPNHAFVTYDEVFINLNHPSWVNSNTLVEQNRLFIGIGTTFSPEVELDVGYLNQYQFKNQDEMSNVLMVKLNVNFQ